MNNSNTPSYYVMAFGVALVISANYGLVTAVLWPDGLYGLPVVFLSVFGLVLSAPLPFRAREGVHAHKLTVAKLKHEAATVGASPVAAGRGIPNDLKSENDPLAVLPEAWRGYVVTRLEAVRDRKEQGPHYSSGWDGVMEYQVWKVVTHILRELNLIDPVTNRQRTVFADGVNATSAALVVRSAKSIPLPQMVTFGPPITEHKNTEETGVS